MNIQRLTDRIRNRTSRRGTNAIEFALTAPVLFFLILATMDFGWYFAHRIILENCTTHSARVAAAVIGSNDLTGITAPDTEGKAMWAGFGLPGEPTFTPMLQVTGATDMVHVVGSVPYSSLGGWDKMLGPSMAVLPSTIDITVARRLENQL